MKKWRAESSMIKYYYIRSGDGLFKVWSEPDWDYSYDSNRYKSGNYFRTRKEAEAKLKQIKKILKG